MGAAKARSAKGGRVKAKNAKAKRAKPRAKAKPPKSNSAASPRPFRFTAAHAVQIRFAGGNRLETFGVDDMAEAALVTLDGEAKHYFQYRLLSSDQKQPDGSDRVFWFFDPKPVGAADPIGPSLWQHVSELPLDGHEIVKSQSGNFSTRSITGYDGSGVRYVVKEAGPYLMRFDFNGKREFCRSLKVSVGKRDVLVVSE
jgi:hypothetical protein